MTYILISAVAFSAGVIVGDFFARRQERRRVAFMRRLSTEGA